MADYTAAQVQETPPMAISRFMAAALGRHCGLGGDDRALFEIIIARLATALSQGHVCIDLSERQREIISASPLVAEEKKAPLVLSASRLYFGRYYSYESELAAALQKLAVRKDGITPPAQPYDQIDTMVDDPHQRQAIEIALAKGFCIISGGPGTGKTTLILKIISLLQVRLGGDPRIALTAPTGKAAMRMQESVQQQVADYGCAADSGGELAVKIPDQAVTLHRLLGFGRFSKQPKYNQSNPMAADVVIVDEASMVDLAMMWKLVNGLKSGARLILLGDRDQLASVESGAVLADCIDSLPDNVAMLQKSYRFSREIGCFAEAVKAGDDDRAWDLCSRSRGSAVSVAGSDWFDEISDAYGQYIKQASSIVDSEAYPAVFERFNRYRVLCALRKGPRGAEEINRRVDSRLAQHGVGAGREWYRGRPIIITRNDHRLGLYNGDIGICLPDPAADYELRAWFDSGGGGLRKFIPAQIPAHETAWALTIHKSQGSEFDEVLIVFPEKDNQVLCMELLYTALTRAREKISLVISEEICRIAVSRKTARHSGLASRLANESA